MRERSEFGLYLNSLCLLGQGVEVGVFRGEFAECILESWFGRKLLLVDPWEHLSDYLDSSKLSDVEMDKNYHLTTARLAKFKHRISILRMRSEVAAKGIEDLSCDFIYIDGNHSYSHVRRDLTIWYPKLRPGGVMSGHDYYDALANDNFEPVLGQSAVGISKERLTSFGVKSAVDEFTKIYGVDVSTTTEIYPSWYFRKTN